MNESVDYIIVGAGAAGPVLAARLSEDSSTQVALLEAGQENTNDLGRMQGAFFQTWGTEMDWSFQTVPQAHLGQRRIAEPRGRVMGGSTALNVGAWMRGCETDYNEWEAAGATGWNWENVLPIFRKIEDTDRGPNEWRGLGGPISMEDLPTPTPFSETLLQAFTEAGFGPRGDTNGRSPFVADRYQTIFPSRVRRTPADAYLTSDVRKRGNLQIITGAEATKIVMEGQRAAGIEYWKDDKKNEIRARREVVLCSGAFGTPKLLMLSGIGPANHLETMGIPVVMNSPGVGSHLQDHLMVSLRVLSPITKGGPLAAWPQSSDIEEWRVNKTGLAAYWIQNGVGFVRTRSELLAPDVELMFQYTPDLSGGAFDHVIDAHSRGGYTISIILLQPKSRGTIRLSSGDPFATPLIDPKFLSHPDDLVTIKVALDIAKNITRTPSLRPHTEFIYPAEKNSEQEINDWVTREAGIAFHPVGSARMGAVSDVNSVVDPELRVKGIEGLRIADASVFPKLIRGHTMAPTIMVAERAAALLRR